MKCKCMHFQSYCYFIMLAEGEHTRHCVYWSVQECLTLKRAKAIIVALTHGSKQSAVTSEPLSLWLRNCHHLIRDVIANEMICRVYPTLNHRAKTRHETNFLRNEHVKLFTYLWKKTHISFPVHSIVL